MRPFYRSTLPCLFLSAILAIAPLCLAQAKAPARPPLKQAPAKAAAPETAHPRDVRTKFANDVLQMAIALPSPSSSDRLRVLAAAIPVASTVDPKLAKKLAEEGTEIESRMIANGQKPAESVLQSSQVGCKTAQQFVDALNPAAVYEAEQSLLGAMASCSKTLDAVRNKLDIAMTQDVIAPRALMAAMEASGFQSAWTQQAFDTVFSSLPKDDKLAEKIAPDIANLYAEAAPGVGVEAASKAGLALLEWLGKLPEGDPRNLAINVTTGAMKQALGDKKYEEALASNVMARQAAQTAGQQGEVEPPPEENVSVLQAMGEKEDRTSELSDLPPSLQAREAAASGFARGTEGDPASANRYFDMAFSAADAAWGERGDETHNKAAAVVTEVSEAAAQVDPVNALQRAERMQDPTAEAISMLAVARVVLTRQLGLQPVPAARAAK